MEQEVPRLCMEEMKPKKEPLSVKDLYWLVGILEGEGCFALNKGTSPHIALSMTDQDIVEKVCSLLNKGTVTPKKPDERKASYKQAWEWHLYGNDAIQVMMTLVSLMGKRRKQKITDIIDIWKNKSNYTHRTRYITNREDLKKDFISNLFSNKELQEKYTLSKSHVEHIKAKCKQLNLLEK